MNFIDRFFETNSLSWMVLLLIWMCGMASGIAAVLLKEEISLLPFVAAMIFVYYVTRDAR